jgi:hypothetical protein
MKSLSKIFFLLELDAMGAGLEENLMPPLALNRRVLSSNPKFGRISQV